MISLAIFVVVATILASLFLTPSVPLVFGFIALTATFAVEGANYPFLAALHDTLKVVTGSIFGGLLLEIAISALWKKKP